MMGTLFGTHWAFLTRQFSKKNIFDDKYSVQCAIFVIMCCQYIERDILDETIDLSQTSPESMYQGRFFSIAKSATDPAHRRIVISLFIFFCDDLIES